MLVPSLLLAASSAFADCNKVTVVDDPLDGRSVGYHLDFDRHGVTGLTLNYIQGHWTLRLYAAARGVSSKRGDKRHKARFVVGDDVVMLRAAGRSWPLTGVQPRTGLFTQWRFDFYISDEKLAALSKDRVKAVGLSLSDLEHRFTLSRRKGHKLRDALTCAMDQVQTVAAK
ncbi:MAG: hypothetical protein AAF211_25315 [Myxococcota bacterium]